MDLTSRRRFVAGALTAAASAIAACAPPQPTFTPVPPTAAPKPTEAAKPAAAAPTTAPAAGGARSPAAGATTAPGATVAPAAAPGKAGGAPVKLTFWTHNYQPLITFTEKKIKEYKNEVPNVDIEYSNTDVPSHETRIVTTLAAGAGFPDGFNSGEYWVAMHNEKKNIAVIPPEAFGKSTQPELTGLFYDYALPGLVVEGKMYAIPIEWNALNLYYDKSIFKEAGVEAPPKTWDELNDIGVKTTKRDSAGNITRPGFQVHYKNPEWILKRINPMAISLGAGMLSPDLQEAWFNKPETIDAIQTYTDWTTKYKISQPGFNVPNVPNSQTETVKGYRAMQTSGPYFPASLKQADPNYKFKEQWDLADQPQFAAGKKKQDTSALWRWALYLSAPSKNQLEMAKYYSFVLKDWKGIHTEVGFIPSLKGWENEPYTKDLPWLPAQMKMLQIAVPVPQTPRYPELAQINMEMMERIESGQQTVKQSADEATKKMNDILKAARK